MKRVPLPAILWLVACGHGGPTTSTPTPVGPPQLTSLRISGNTALTVVGQTSQLTATATYSDGTAKEVTNETRWTSSDPSIVQVSSTGLVTVSQFGASTIFALYSPVSASVSLRPSPPGTFVISGWVREPGEGSLVGVKVTDTLANVVTETKSDGHYNLVALPRGEAHLTFRKDEYESAEIDATQGTADASMQRIIRLRPGETVSPPRFAPNDFSYVVGSGRCSPCRLVRVDATAAGTFRVRVTWKEPAVTISLWANGSVSTGSDGELVADIAVPAGESVVYLGLNVPRGPGPAYHVPFTIQTSIP